MLTVSIEDPENFQLASPVVKDSKTGISTNKRLLVLKGGHLFYYSSVPKSFDGDPNVLEYHHQLPKGSIDVLTIKRIRTPNMTSPDFEVVFDSKHLMEREDIRKTVTSEGYIFTPKDSKDDTVWRFTCDNHFIKQKWIASILALIKHYQAVKERIHQYFDSLGKHKDQPARNPSFGKSYNPWKAGERKNDTRSLADRLGEDDFGDADWGSKKPQSCKNFSNSFSGHLGMGQEGMSLKEGRMEEVSMKRKGRQKGGFD